MMNNRIKVLLMVLTFCLSINCAVWAAYEDEVLADTPELYLRFSSLPFADSSGNDHWVYKGGGASLSSKDGLDGCVQLNGSNSSLVAAANHEILEWPEEPIHGDEFSFNPAYPGDITFEYWCKIDSMSTYGMWFQQIGIWENENQAPGVGQAENQGTPEPDGTIRICTGTEDPCDDDFWYTNVPTPQDGGWHHYVITYDESADDDDPNYIMTIQIYLDGELADANSFGTPDNHAKMGPELDHLMIGGENNRGYTYNTVTGYMDEFAVYTYILGPDRVWAHFDEGLPKTCEELINRGMGYPADIDEDCDVDLADIAAMSTSWILCNDPNDIAPPECVPNWPLGQ
ncbi:MAG: LamG domain-containing protein [Sedimentisphaerales bacterium]|nr:LamG domain-containing protein [Sedimentisphaerales bacterium]